MTGSRPLTELEIQNIIQAFTGKYELRNRALFLLGLNTGARISELLSLNVEDVWRYNRPVDIIYFQKRHTKGKLVGRQITISYVSSNSKKVIPLQPRINTEEKANQEKVKKEVHK